MIKISPGNLSIVRESETNPTFWDALHRLGGGPEVALLHAMALWPELVDVEGFVVLSENCDPDYFSRTRRECGDANLEATINTTYLDSLFGAAAAAPEVSEALGQIICESWTARARHLFPDRQFVTHFGWYSANGDAGVVLHQLKWPCQLCR